jgi:hypothetical protein
LPPRDAAQLMFAGAAQGAARPIANWQITTSPPTTTTQTESVI